MKLFQLFVFSVFLTTLGFSEIASRDDIFNSMQNNLSWNTCFAMQVKAETQIGIQSDSKRRTTLTFRRKGNSTEWPEESVILDSKGQVDRNKEFYKRIRIMTEDRDYDIYQRQGQGGYVGWFGDYNPEEQAGWLRHKEYGSFLDGISSALGSSYKLSEEFRKHNAQIAGEEVVNGVPCVLFKMTTPYGKVKAWLDPQRNYSILKYTLVKTAQDLWKDKPLSESTIKDWAIAVENIEIEKTGEYFIPTKGTYTRKAIFKDGTERIVRLNVWRENIDLNPDFEKLGAFKPNIPNGSILYDRRDRSVQYKWIDGELVPYIVEKESSPEDPNHAACSGR